MVKMISLFNHKGGVSKTTTTFNLGWALADLGYKVIMVDGDPQCNLTGMALDFSGMDDFEYFYENNPECNIKDALKPAFSSQPVPIKPVKCLEVAGRSNLFVLPGHVGFSEYDVPLGIAQEMSGSLQVTQNLPGSINFLLQETAKMYEADFVLIDMSPSINSINQNLFMLSDYFIIPCSPDYFCLMAIDSLCNVFPNWVDWGKRMRENRVYAEAYYPVPSTPPKFLGTISQRYRPRDKSPAKSFQKWIDKINGRVQKKLVPTLKNLDMLIDTYDIQDDGSTPDYNLSYISDFNSLIAQSQKHKVAVFALTDEQIEQSGKILETQRANREDFKQVFLELAQKIIDRT
ncbi:ParA family protein [Anoxybacillus sp. J5B_2022]|uniref:ParA family protein n=1 Tax=Anoxybacillus sp. J5B_2022 TaxID=3003246 RepID=UPI0022863E40|nr:AAA family ATPase [Anoxybacillus sp. J5B_2022]MCZ0755593.1 AAA family ATPase [Anoxybacillus sp. J5B_2022]